MSQTFDPFQQWLGIPPKQRPIDFYTLLGLRIFENDSKLISQAADLRRAMVERFLSGSHPDEARRILKLIEDAKACLLDPSRRRQYDERLRAKLRKGPPPLHPQTDAAAIAQSAVEVVAVTPGEGLLSSGSSTSANQQQSDEYAILASDLDSPQAAPSKASTISKQGSRRNAADAG